MHLCTFCIFFFFFQAEDGIRDLTVTGVQTCALPISSASTSAPPSRKPSPMPLRTATIETRGASCAYGSRRSEEHTSELQSQSNLVCRLLLEKQTTPSSPCRRRHPPRAPRCRW